jgi:hypothetical protein
MITIKYSCGNSKLGKDILILNITSALNCPSKRLGLCNVAKYCYAIADELQYNKHLPQFHEQQAKYWDSLSVVEYSNQVNEIIKKHHINYVRFNESGDFKNQADVRKLDYISKRIIVPVYAYTKRSDLNFTKINNNLTINGSGFMVHNNLKVVSEYTSKIQCKGDCRICQLCKSRKGIVIQEKIRIRTILGLKKNTVIKL